MADVKRVYTFGNKEAEGNGKMRELLGGKGANLAEMNLIGIPVPPGFTITTEVCAEFYKHGKEAVIEMLRPEVERAMKNIEKLTGMKFGDKEMPLLVSVRSGARASMPGMMDTILNLGMNDQAVEAVAKRTGNPRFAWDSYRRFVQMYGDVVLGMKPVSKEDHDPFEVIIEEQKAKKGVKNDTDLTTDDLKELVKNFKAAVKKQTGEDFPTCPWDQLWGAICAVFGSWMNERAILYRKLNNIPAEWGTAVSVQAMVFGNMGENSATGVAFSRDAATGENLFNGEYLINAQGEDVVAGIRTPQQITIEGSKRWAVAQKVSEEERKAKFPSLEEVMPEVYKELDEIQHHLEQYFKDMQDIEFTIQDGKLWMLQCRNGKRPGAALVKPLAAAGKEVIAVDKDEAKVKAVRGYTDYAFVIDELDETSLKETGMQNCGTVTICIGEQIDISILTTMLVTKLGVPHVISKAASEVHGEVLKRLGAEVVYPEADMAVRIGKRLISGNLLDYIALGDGVEVRRITVGGRMLGKSVRTLDLRKAYGINIIAVEHGQQTNVEFSADYTFKEGDTVAVIGKVGKIDKFEKEM